MMIENYPEYQDVRRELRAMGVSIGIIEYVESCVKIAYALGARDGLKEGRAISIAKDQKRLLSATGEEC